MSTAIFNVSATTFVNNPVTISLSGLVKPNSTIRVVAGDASAYQQNVTYVPPLDFVGTAMVDCEISDGNKVSISILVVQKPTNSPDATNQIRRQVRETTMAGDPVEERFWSIVEDSGKIEGPMAAYVPLKIQKVTALEYVEDHPPEACLEPWPASNYFSTEGAGSWIQFDLGQVCNISEIDIHWHGICNFSLAISNDRKGFVNVYQGRGVGVSNINMPKAAAVTFKITAMDNLMEIAYVSVKGSPVTPKPTQTGAQAVLLHSSQMVKPGQLVVMDGSQSRGDILRFVWENPSPQITLFNDKTSIASFIAPDVDYPTTYQFSMTVVDRNGQYSKAVSMIHVEGYKPPVEPASTQSLDDLYKKHPCCVEPIPPVVIDFCGDCGKSFQTTKDFIEHKDYCKKKEKEV